MSVILAPRTKKTLEKLLPKFLPKKCLIFGKKYVGGTLVIKKICIFKKELFLLSQENSIDRVK